MKAEFGSKEEFDLYMKAAELGNAEAQYKVGWRYFHSQGVAKDNYEAFKWFKKSADQGYVDAIYKVGEAYMYSQGVQEDYKMAEKYFLSAAYKGYGDAYFDLGWLYQSRLKNKNEAIYWHKKYVDYTYAEWGEPSSTSLECLRELGVYYHPNEKSSNSSQTQSQAQNQTQTQTQQVYTPEYGVRDVWVNCFDCHGTGQCSYCKGTGWCISTNGHGEYNSTYKCTICHGSGRCTYCNGSGGHYEKQQYQIR
ncbi:MAG: SEL1-like repeat protein [Alistipes sp.]|nr:SEL1-like repeat protein [Alistipes sp.]